LVGMVHEAVGGEHLQGGAYDEQGVALGHLQSEGGVDRWKCWLEGKYKLAAYGLRQVPYIVGKPLTPRNTSAQYIPVRKRARPRARERCLRT
jgi:hypothetical protein